MSHTSVPPTAKDMHVHISIPVTSTEKETLGGLPRLYTAFHIHVNCEHAGEWDVKRRYSEFLVLHRKLGKEFPEVLTGLSNFPKKRLVLRRETETVEERRHFFQTYLQALVALEPRPSIVGSFLEMWHRKPVKVPRLADFEIIKTLGGGNFGKVFLVHLDKTSYAMKVLKKDMIVKKNQVEHVTTEREVGSTIHNHPFIVPVLYSYQTDHRLYMISEFCAGGDMFFHLRNMRRFPEAMVKFYSAQVFLALDFLHTLSIVYRDLKPENIMLDAKGNAKLTDFGLSKYRVDDFSGAKTFCGTPEYLAPEILELQNKGEREEYGYSVDWWCFGNLICELMTGHPPFEAENPREMRRKILTEDVALTTASAPLQDLVKGLLKRLPGERLTAKQIRVHAFWTTEWEDVLDKIPQPPIHPIVDTVDEAINFDEEETSSKSVAQTPRASYMSDVECEDDLSELFKAFAKDNGWVANADATIKEENEEYEYVWGASDDDVTS